MLHEITLRLDANLSRVKNLVNLYGPTSRGRTAVNHTDILRAALVLLHASLEDYLRSLLIWKIDTFDKDYLNGGNFSIGNNNHQNRIYLGDLSCFRETDKSIAELITDSVRHHLENNKSFSNLGEVKGALIQSGISKAEVDQHDFGKLFTMIKRRHDIVHKADRNEKDRGQGNHRTKSLKKAHVEDYINSVEALKLFVSDRLR